MRIFTSDKAVEPCMKSVKELCDTNMSLIDTPSQNNVVLSLLCPSVFLHALVGSGKETSPRRSSQRKTYCIRIAFSFSLRQRNMDGAVAIGKRAVRRSKSNDEPFTIK